MFQFISEVFEEPENNSGIYVGPASIQDEVSLLCINLVRQMTDKIEAGDYCASSLDAYDVFAAALSYLCLTLRREQTQRARPLAQSTEMVRKSTTVLTLVGEKFSGFKKVIAVLWALLDHVIQVKTSPESVSVLKTCCRLTLTARP